MMHPHRAQGQDTAHNMARLRRVGTVSSQSVVSQRGGCTMSGSSRGSNGMLALQG